MTDLIFYAGLEDITERDTGKHITLCYSKAKPTGKVRLSLAQGAAVVKSIEYWPIPDVTVAVVECDLAMERHFAYVDAGHGYDYKYIPHITLGWGDVRAKWGHWVGTVRRVGREYFTIREA